MKPPKKPRAAGGVRTDAVALQREVLLVAGRPVAGPLAAATRAAAGGGRVVGVSAAHVPCAIAVRVRLEPPSWTVVSVAWITLRRAMRRTPMLQDRATETGAMHGSGRPIEPSPGAYPAIWRRRARPCRFLDQEEDDQPAEDDLLDVLAGGPDRRVPPAMARATMSIRATGSSTMNAGPEERPRDAAEAADDDDEEDLKRAIEVEAVRLDGAEVGERPERAGDAAENELIRERRELGRAGSGCRPPRRRCPCRAPPSSCGRRRRARGCERAACSTTTTEQRQQVAAARVGEVDAERRRAAAR